VPRVSSVRLYHVRIPLRRPFKHAAAERAVADNIVCRVTLEDGAEGWGEGVPRRYVTGETPQTCFEEFDRRGRRLLECTADSLDELLGWLQAHALPLVASASAGPSAAQPRYVPHAYWCACETALLDAFGHALGFSLSEAVARLARPEDIRPHPMVQYSAVISSGALWRECLLAGAMLLAGFHHFKAKIGFEPQEDLKRVQWLRRTLGGNDLRLDANGAWSPAEAREALEAIAPYRPSCIEQPVAPGREETLPGLRELGVAVMLDESVRTLSEARRALTEGWCDLVNVRISKCGGVLASVRMLAEVRRAGGRAQLGCQVGETGLLSAAGRHLAATLGPWEYLEGSYDRYLLSVQLTEPDITFGSGGWAPPLRGRGLGVKVKPKVLERFTVKETVVPW